MGDIQEMVQVEENLLNKIPPRIDLIYSLFDLEWKESMTKLDILKKTGFQPQVCNYDTLHLLEKYNILVVDKIIMNVSFYKLNKGNLIKLIKKSLLYKKHVSIYLWK